MRQGTATGCLADYRIFGDPWGFSTGDVTVPVDIWEGTEDRTGPPDYRDLLLRRLPEARLFLVPDEGHLSLQAHRAEDILGRVGLARAGGDVEAGGPAWSAADAQAQRAESMARWKVG